MHSHRTYDFDFIQHFRSPIRQSDWDGVFKYSSRIQELSIGSRISVEVAEMLGMSLPVACILPNLRRLTWDSQENPLFPHIRLFLGPKVTSITLYLASITTHLSLLSYISSHLPALTVVNIYDISTEQTRTKEEVTAFILGLNKVQSLSVPAILPSAYEHLASLSSLKNLDVRSLHGYSFPNGTPSHGFPVLERLRIHVSNVELARSLLAWCAGTPLVHFHLFCPTSTALCHFFTTFRDHCHHTSYRHRDPFHWRS
jgi:hypothetical protein